MLDILMHAAKLAADLSAYREKQIALVLTTDGVRITGTYPGWKYDHIVSWREIADGRANILSAEIERINGELMGRWRDDYQPKPTEIGGQSNG